jgi:hypothetical protein
MAPNVKQIALLSQLLENLDIVQQKFLPLTHPSEEQQQQKVQESVTSDSYSYWDWPSEDVVDDSAPTKDLFSVSNIESNLLKEAEKLNTKSDDKVVVEKHNNNYWEEKVEDTLNNCGDNVVDAAEITANNVPQHEVSYWDWRVDERQTRIESILQEEYARKQVSAERIQAHILVDSWKRKTNLDEVVAKKNKHHDSYWNWESPVVSPRTMDASHPCFSYWDWTSDANCDNNGNVQKAKLIDVILQEELLRDMLSVKHMELAEQNSTAKGRPILSCRSPSDDYWTFPSEKNENAHYWDWGNTSDTESYWVM